MYDGDYFIVARENAFAVDIWLSYDNRDYLQMGSYEISKPAKKKTYPYLKKKLHTHDDRTNGLRIVYPLPE